MLTDVTVDTNVFLHSANKAEDYFESSREFLDLLLSNTTKLCVDDGFDLDESKNRSAIGCEYIEKLRFVSSAYAVIVALGKSGRIVKVSKQIPQRAGKKIMQLVRKKSDRIFLKVACNSRSRVLVSHDFEDFSTEKRAEIRRQIEVNTATAGDALNL